MSRIDYCSYLYAFLRISYLHVAYLAMKTNGTVMYLDQDVIQGLAGDSIEDI